MGDSSRLCCAILNDNDGSGIDVLACPVLRGLRYVSARVPHECMDSCSER